MTKSTITREQLEEWVAQFDEDGGCDATDRQLEALIRQSLAEIDSDPVAWLAIYHGEVYDEVIGITRSVVEAQADRFGWESALTEIIPLYRHAQPAPVVPAVSDDIGEIRVGRLPTMNQDDYPGLGDWWVQLRIGEDSDEVLARVYGATPQEANNRAEALACRAAMLQELKKSAGTEAICRSDENVQVLHANPPVIPDGSASMLRRWLAFGRGMQNAGSQLPHNLIAETESMLAAAPKEVKGE
ncbi:TPA: hypothetical protein ACPUM1_000598 [Klebsiella pneumoniae]